MAALRVISTMPSSDTLSTRQRVALLRNVLDIDQALSISDSEINFALFLRRKIPIQNFRASAITPIELQSRGVESALQLRQLGFDALDLLDPGFCSATVAAYGSEPVRSAFLIEACDAVAVAGSFAVDQLDCGVEFLLRLCAGAPQQARAVIEQTKPRGGALHGVSVNAVLDTGLRATALCELGYSSDSLANQLGCTERELGFLGF